MSCLSDIYSPMHQPTALTICEIRLPPTNKRNFPPLLKCVAKYKNVCTKTFLYHVFWVLHEHFFFRQVREWMKSTPRVLHSVVVFTNEARISTEGKQTLMCKSICDGAYVAHSTAAWMLTYLINAYLYTKPKFIHL